MGRALSNLKAQTNKRFKFGSMSHELLGFPSRIIFFFFLYSVYHGITSIIFWLFARGILTVATCHSHQAAWWFSRFVGPNIDVSLFTNLDTRKIEPNLCCRNFVIFFFGLRLVSFWRR